MSKSNKILKTLGEGCDSLSEVSDELGEHPPNLQDDINKLKTDNLIRTCRGIGTELTEAGKEKYWEITGENPNFEAGNGLYNPDGLTGVSQNLPTIEDVEVFDYVAQGFSPETIKKQGNYELANHFAAKWIRRGLVDSESYRLTTEGIDLYVELCRQDSI